MVIAAAVILFVYSFYPARLFPADAIRGRHDVVCRLRSPSHTEVRVVTHAQHAVTYIFTDL